MSEAAQTGWTRVLAPTGRYEYQFQGRTPSVRNGKYEDANDYVFLVMDEEGWLYKIPVRMSAEAEAEFHVRPAAQLSGEAHPGRAITPTQIAEAQLRAGLENYRPRQNAPYEELDGHFAVDVHRAHELAVRMSS